MPTADAEVTLRVHEAALSSPAMIGIGIAGVLMGLVAIVRPDTFRNAPRESLPPWHGAITRFIGAAFCVVGIGLIIFGVSR